MSSLTIGQVAKRSGASIDTIRFYERKNLIAPACRKDSGYRQFHPHVVDKITFIQHAKGLGFTLKEIEDLLSMRQSPNAMALEVKQKAQEKIVDIDSKIRRLSQIREELANLTSLCSGDGPASLCPILHAIDAVAT